MCPEVAVMYWEIQGFSFGMRIGHITFFIIIMEDFRIEMDYLKISYILKLKLISVMVIY